MSIHGTTNPFSLHYNKFFFTWYSISTQNTIRSPANGTLKITLRLKPWPSPCTISAGVWNRHHPAHQTDSQLMLNWGAFTPRMVLYISSSISSLSVFPIINHQSIVALLYLYWAFYSLYRFQIYHFHIDQCWAAAQKEKKTLHNHGFGFLLGRL